MAKKAAFNLKTATEDAIAKKLLELNKEEGTPELPYVDYSGYVTYPDDREPLFQGEICMTEFPYQCGANVIGEFPEDDLSEGVELELALIVKHHMSECDGALLATLTQHQGGAAKLLTTLGWTAIQKFTNGNTGNKITVFCYES